MNKWFLIIHLFFCLIYVFCGSDTAVTLGPGSETIAITGKIVNKNGDPVSGAPVVLRNRNYLSALPGDNNTVQNNTTSDTVTDQNGNFKLSVSDTGSYVIEINDFNRNALIMACTVPALTEKIMLPVDTVKPTGTLSGSVILTEKHNPVYVRVYGMDRISKTDSVNGKFSITDMPEGAYNLEVTILNDLQRSFPLTDIPVISDSVTDMGMIDLQSGSVINNSRKIFLNTSSSGAAISSTIIDFPVLVRLNSSNFDFKESLHNGADIIFTKSDNSILAHEIERWDPNLQKADIWVRIDTLYGNNDSQFINMSVAGNSITNRLTPADVFDTSSGFQCVLHFNESMDTVKDATGNHYNAVYAGSTIHSTIEGQIGAASGFNGSDDYFILPGTADSKLHFAENSSYTISAWVYTDTLAHEYRTIIAKGDFRYGLQLHNNDNFEIYDYKNGSGWDAVRAPGTQKKWTHIAGVCIQNQMLIYIDGELASNQNLPVTDTTVTDFTHDVCIGRMSEFASRYWNGALDEIRFCTVARSAEWIKACYSNQKSDDLLIKFEY